MAVDNSWAHLWGPRWLGNVWVVAAAGLIALAQAFNLVLTALSNEAWKDVRQAAFLLLIVSGIFAQALVMWRYRRRERRASPGWASTLKTED